MTLVGLAAIIVGVTIAYMVGGAIIFKLAIAEDIYQYGVYFLSGLCSLKMLDAVVKNADEIIGSITKGIKDVVKNLINKLTGGS